ncbi:hypothetical protein BC829DRAFT_185487 [Chytridium lagenaria]|nr:hypothetical protein BC829DRAFT_185487 [Chytridium lagenaria]
MEEEIRNQRIQAKVSELVTLKCLKTLGTHFSAWKNLIFQQHHSIKKIQMISNWRTLNRFWVRWRVSKKRKEGRRQAEETARILKLEHEANQRALRHYCGYLLSKAMVGWKKWARLERDTRIIRQQHEERSRKMKAFMEQLEKAKIEEREQDLGLRENESPAMNKTNGTPILKLSQSCSQLRHVSKSLPASNSFGAHQHTAPAAEQHALKDLHEIESCNQVTFIHPVPTTEPGEKDANAKLEQTAPKPKKLRSARDMELIENMQKRDEERKKRKELLEQKRKEKQEMLENQKREQERLKQESEEAERRRYLEQKLEEQRLIREAEDRKRAEKEKHLSLIKQADDRYKKSLLKKRGIAPWRVFTALHRQDTDRACDFQQLWSIKGPLLQWFRKTEDKWKLKEHNAETFRKKRLITKFMKMWLNVSLFVTREF